MNFDDLPILPPGPRQRVTYPKWELSAPCRSRIEELVENSQYLWWEKHCKCDRNKDDRFKVVGDDRKFSKTCLGLECKGNQYKAPFLVWQQIEKAMTLAGAEHAASDQRYVSPSRYSRELGDCEIPEGIKTLKELKAYNAELLKSAPPIREKKGRPKGRTLQRDSEHPAALARKIRDIFYSAGVSVRPSATSTPPAFEILCDVVRVLFPRAKNSQIESAIKKP